MDTIDITPTPAEYATIARHVITAAYGLQVDQLTDYQVLWAWSATEHAADRIGTPIHNLPVPLGTEMLRMYIARAHTVSDRPVDAATTYEQLNTPAAVSVGRGR